MVIDSGHYGGDGGTNWGAVAGAGILGALLGAAAAPQQQPQIIVVVPPQPIYAAPQPVPGISEREFLEHYNPTPPPSQRIWPTYVSPVPSQRIWWCRREPIFLAIKKKGGGRPELIASTRSL